WHSMVRDLIRGTIDRHRRLGAERDEIATLREQNAALVDALEQLTAQVDAGRSADYSALQEHRSMRVARAALVSAKGGAA
ncbi:hypothetical protein, partial [Klebsiella pneumoniae]|uniref:hypothetical protein n=1 Tax=Klebsiella pneumoniae TaxID=573 RepID=UPI003F51D72E